MQIGFVSNFIARAVFIAVLLAGLLVSSGEGIHLFPFPPAEISGNRHLLATNTERGIYQENALRLDQAQKKGQSGSERDKQHVTGSLPAAAELVDRHLAVTGGSKFSNNSHLFLLQLFSSRLRGRAPPVS